MLAHPNPDDFQSSNASRMDENLLVRFFYKEREDKSKTLSEGRPCFKEVEYVEIRVAGQRDAQACRPATYKDKQRFARHYEAFQKRVELPEEGTLLKEWPQINRSQVEELAYHNIKTVEQLVGTADIHLTKFHGGVGLKQRATQWMEQAGATKLIAEKVELQERLDTMATQLEQLEARLEASEAEKVAPKTVAKKTARKTTGK